MTDRYLNRPTVINDLDRYKPMLKERGLKYAKIFTTPVLSHPTKADIANLNIIAHRWKIGDKYHKLAHQYYDNSEMWWVIAWFNQAPTEAHLSLGQIVYIPTPVGDVLDYYGV